MDHFEMVEKLRQKANVSYEEAKAAGLDVFEGPCFLPFWENGIKYICIMGPNNEVVEFLQKM